MDSAAGSLRADMSNRYTPKASTATGPDDWDKLARKLPRSSLIDRLLDLASIEPVSDPNGPPEIDLTQLTKQMNLRVRYSVSSSSAETLTGKNLTVVIPISFPESDERFAIARSLAVNAISFVFAKCFNKQGKFSAGGRPLAKLIENPLPIEIDAVASAILMPKKSLNEQVAELGSEAGQIANAFSVPLAAAKLRLLTPGVLS